MKTFDIKIALVLILNAALAVLSLTCCGDDTPDKMHWNVYSLNDENVQVTYNPSRRPQIEIVVNAEGGECKIACANYEHVSFREKGHKANAHLDLHCAFHAKNTDHGAITLTFQQMDPQANDVCSYFILDGDDGEDLNTTVVKVTRKFNNADKV